MRLPRADTVLLVDDDPIVRATYEHLLKEHGYEVLSAGDGNEALSCLRESSVGAILLDVFMPDRDGLETLIEVKKEFPGVRVIVMTGGGLGTRQEYLAIASKFGADAIVKKPASIDEILAALRAEI
jgi:DNA-binding response OmpR family regulator